MSGFGHKRGLGFPHKPHGPHHHPHGPHHSTTEVHIHHHHIGSTTQPTPTAPIYPTIPPVPVKAVIVKPNVQKPVSSEEAFAWIATTSRNCDHLLPKAIQAGNEGHDRSPIYVGRAYYEGELIPCKVIPRHKVAYIPYNGREIGVTNIELYCRQEPKVTWVHATNGNVPQRAVAAGRTKNGETLFVGRANHAGSLTPGKVHGSHRCMYISFGGNEISLKSYEVMVVSYS